MQEAKTWGQLLASYNDYRGGKMSLLPQEKSSREGGCCEAKSLKIERKKIEKISRNQDCIESLNRAKVKQIGRCSLYSLLSHKSAVPGNEEPIRCPLWRRHSKIRLLTAKKPGYNILSNLDKKVHHYESPHLRPDKLAEVVGKPKVVRSQRDFNIVSNSYRDFNEDRKEYDSLRKAFQAHKTLLCKSQFHPVTGKFRCKKAELSKEIQEKRDIKYKSEKYRLDRFRYSTTDFDRMETNERIFSSLTKLKSHSKPIPAVTQGFLNFSGSDMDKKVDSRKFNRINRSTYSIIAKSGQKYDIISLEEKKAPE